MRDVNWRRPSSPMKLAHGLYGRGKLDLVAEFFQSIIATAEISTSIPSIARD
jgi:hypothetical protein